MARTLALRQEELTVRHELSPEELLSQGRKIMEIKEKVMVENVHYGIIPGCRKPSLLKPGAEKLCAAFRLNPEFQTTSREDPNRKLEWEKWDSKTRKKLQGVTTGYIEYDSSCTLVHIPTGDVWVKNVSGCCNNFESTYRSQHPYEIKNTLEKMAEKRALVAAVLVGIGASDQFTQDLETLPNLVNGGSSQAPEPEPVKPQQKEEPEKEEKRQATRDDSGLRYATPKQIAYIKGELQRRKIPVDSFLDRWSEGLTTWEKLPFDEVNSILEWIREQRV